MTAALLSDAPAFEALARRMAGGPEDFVTSEPSIDRLRTALDDRRATPADIAVLIRHALRAEVARRGVGSRPRLPAPSGLCLSDDLLFRSGLARTLSGEIESIPWTPDWAPDLAEADDEAAAAARRRFGPGDEGPPGDPFLARLGRTAYRSVGQRAALRAAMLVPPGGALAIDLPTGDGKSLAFVALDRAGFASDPVPPGGRRPGVVLVVVPTVALAYDHENACRRETGEVLAYVGADGADLDARRDAVRSRVGDAQDGLCFASPEAACTGLREALRAAASAGRLKAVVVDEAHLVDAWGTGFRSDFQVLSGLVVELARLSPEGSEPRVILLSATLTPETLVTLRTLFPGKAGLEVISAAQARPEPAYYVVPSENNADRKRRIEEALLHLPRPAILYVTEVDDAVAWGNHLRNLGLGRLRTFHGRTPDPERQETLGAWRSGELDLVVGTSAFGLGIDLAHVRAIVHACVPETFDRFYQEVGRAGRDGRAAASLVLHTRSDLHQARGLNRRLVISVKRGLERWRSMFEHPSSRHLGGMRFRLRLDVAPGTGEEDIDLISERSADWNARLLTLLARASVVRLLGEGTGRELEDAECEDGTFETIEILEAGHLDSNLWSDQVEPVRRSIAGASRRSLNLMKSHLVGSACPFDLIEELYAPGGRGIARACSSCPICRTTPTARRPSRARTEPLPHGTPIAVSSTLTSLLAEGRLLIPYAPEKLGRYGERRMADLFVRLVEHGARSFAVMGTDPGPFGRALATLVDYPVFLERPRSLAARRLPRGLIEVVVVGPDAVLDPSWYQPSVSHQRVLFVPERVEDPERPRELLLDRYGGASLTPDALNTRLAS